MILGHIFLLVSFYIGGVYIVIAFRVDGNEKIGLGHVMRCLSIANMARAENINVVFIVSDMSIVDFISQHDYKVIYLNTLYYNMECEIDLLKTNILQHSVDFIVVDSYFVTSKYMHDLSKIIPIAYIDDLCLEQFDCSILLNYNCYATNMNYDNLYGKTNTTLLLGLEYVPLRDEFTHLTSHICKKNINNILITTGGTDPYNISGILASELLKHPSLFGVTIHIVVGKFYQYTNLLNDLLEKNLNIKLYNDIKSMGALMVNCDIAISASGATLYELCTCGIPTITFIMADNQKYAYDEMLNLGLLGGGNVLNDETLVINNIIQQVVLLNNNYCLRKSISLKMKSLVDAKGTGRIVKSILNVINHSHINLKIGGIN